MPVLTGPLFSLAASGSIGKTLTYSRWRGIQYARTRVIPQNPRTAAQIEVRNAFETLNGMWAMADSNLWDIYEALTRGLPLTAKNAWIRANLAPMIGDTDIGSLTFSPGQTPIPPPTSPSFTPAAGQITIAGTAATAPTGWTLVGAYAFAFGDADPSTGGKPTDYGSGFDATSPFSIVVSGLLAQDYYAAIVAKYVSTNNPSEFRYSRYTRQGPITVP